MKQGWELVVWLDGKRADATCVSRETALTHLKTYVKLADASDKWERFTFTIRKYRPKKGVKK